VSNIVSAPIVGPVCKSLSRSELPGLRAHRTPLILCIQWFGLAVVVSSLSASLFAADEGRIRAAAERVYRQRAASVAMRNVAERLAANPDSETLRIAQWVLDQESDSFTESLSSVRSSIESELRVVPDSVMRRYDSIVDGEADMLLSDAKSNASISAYREVCRRFFLTPAGYFAAERLVALWLDEGEYGLASRLATQVLSEPVHRPRITPQFRLMADSLQQVDRVPMPQGAPADIRAATVAEFQRKFWKHRATLIPLESGWMTLGGSETRNRAVAGSRPVPVPAWTANYFPDQDSRAVQEFLDDWEGTRREVDQPCSPASYPILVNGQAIFRDSVGLRSVDAATGRLNWAYRCSFNPIPVVSRSEARRRLMPTSSATATPNSFGENSVMGAIASNGDLVFAIDSPANTATDQPTVPSQRFRNRLLGVYANGVDAGRVAWVQEGVLPASSKKEEGSATFTFLGPPLPGTSELLCVTEHDADVHLTALEPRTGSVIWTQPLCTLDRVEQFDLERHDTVCLPARDDGIVVCPTNTGLLVAVDQVRLNLLWAAFVDELPDPKRQPIRFGGRMPQSPAAGYAGYASHVLISKGRVVYLPGHSSQLHCLDLATGQFVWSVPRGDAEFIGTISDQVLVVGRQSCRSLSLDDGRERWSVSTGVPAGRGVTVGNRYLLPLDGGRLAAFDLETGTDQGTHAFRSTVSLGHLVADEQRVYSLSQRGLAAFPQVDFVLAGIDPNKSNLGPTRQIMLAEVAVVQGNLDSGERQLRKILGGELTTPDRVRARRDLKELYFEKIRTGQPLEQDEFDHLDALLETPTEQFRFVVSVAGKQAQRLSADLREQLAQRAYELPPQVNGVSTTDAAEWEISPAVWCRLQLQNSTMEGFGPSVQSLRNERRPRLRGEESSQEIQRYLRAFDGPDLADTRSYLASRYANEGATHAAEVLWLRNRQEDDNEVAAEASLKLAELWERTGFVSDAARQLESLATTYARTSLPSGVTGAEYVGRLSANHSAKRVWLQSHEPKWSVDHVEIRQAAAQPDFVQANLPGGAPDRESVRFQPDRTEITARGNLSRIGGQIVEFVTYQTQFEDQQIMSIFDQRTKTRLGSLTLPVARRFASFDKLASGGHFIPIGIPGGIVGVSTLQLGDSTPVWQQLPADLAGRRSPVSPGPSGAGYVSFFWRNRLYVVDPLDGSLLWHRMIPTQEPAQSQRLDIIGDQYVLAVPGVDQSVDPPRRNYEVFETTTGRKLATVNPGFMPGNWQGWSGRFAMGIADTREGRRLQIYDLMKNAVEVSEVIGEGGRQPILFQNELVYLGGGGELKIFDLTKGLKTLSAQFTVAELLLPIGAIRVFSDETRYFVNLQRHTPTATTSHFNQALNSQMPGVSVRDDLYAFDRATNELIWKRSVPNRRILQFPDCHLPFLVMISHVKDRVNNSLESLTIEVIDSQSGATIGYRENLTFDRQLLTAQYDGEQGQILIRGMVSDIELRFGPAEGQTQAIR